LLLEVYLYEGQTRRGIDKKHYENFNDISDHCTVCARCYPKCPVDINFADVTANLRNILNLMGQKKTHPVVKFGNLFLTNTNPLLINTLKKLFFVSYKIQRYAHKILKHYPSLKKQLKKPPTTTCKQPAIKEQIIHFINRPLPQDIGYQTLSSILSINNSYNVYLIPVKNPKYSVFYFAGCGSEKLYPKIAIATIAMLHDSGFQVVLPPPNLCCGYPQAAAGDKKIADNIMTANKVLFHRIATTLNYTDIEKVIVSCGTCFDKLLDYEFNKIFPQAKIIDIHEFLQEQNVSVQLDKNFLFHDPCHSPTKNINPIKMTQDLLENHQKNNITLTDKCCGESGTFALNRCDISTQVKFKKNQNLQESMQKNNKTSTILTTCPSCLQGLSRYHSETKLNADYLVCKMAEKKWGSDWQNICTKKIIENGIESILI
jgi:Fe-S oxidoreductase